MILSGDDKGFTLLEILVTIALVSMVTLVVAMALKLGIDSWQKGEKEGDAMYLSLSIPSLMGRQLEAVSRQSTLSTGRIKKQLSFCGSEHAISFFTTFGPMGSPLQGLLRSTYVYDVDDETLYLFQEVVTKGEDIKEELNPFSEERRDRLEPVSEIKGVAAFNLMYNGQSLVDPQEENSWKKEWKCSSPVHPTAVRLSLNIGKKDKREPSVWYFHVGQPGLQEWRR